MIHELREGNESTHESGPRLTDPLVALQPTLELFATVGRLVRGSGVPLKILVGLRIILRMRKD
ncbi:hypothetical protein J6590_001555 [Homalodisca vitripennis]|nr:hypothetical protein J6590_001555 [Homalodisca vitripennis]